jgi:hypothetical protein
MAIKFLDNQKAQDMTATLILFGVVIVLTVFSMFILNPIHKKNIQKLSEPPLITCNQCKGSGEYPTDINKLMMDASLALYLNHHLMVDRCEKCVKLPNGDGNKYCQAANDYYQTLLKEHDAAGPKIDMAACEKCMGMGQFTSVKKDGSYLTQEEYDQENKEK